MKVSEEFQVDLDIVPTTFRWARIETSGGPFILLTCSTPLGTNVYWMPPENAKEVAAGLDELASRRITIAKQLPPDGSHP